MLTLLIEARTPRRKEDPSHIIKGIGKTLTFMLHWVEKNQAALLGTLPDSKNKSSVVISASTIKGDKKPCYRFMDTQTGNIRGVTLPGAYKMNVIIHKTVTPPIAYGVPIDLISLNEVLKRHGFLSHPGKSYRYHRIEAYWIEAILKARRPNHAPRKLTISQKDLSPYLISPLSPKTVIPLTIYLEPASIYGLVRFKEMGIVMKASSFYPILRIF